jgi:hypothetical protein
LNYVGVVLCGLSGLFYLFVRSDSQVPDERQALIEHDEIAQAVLTTNNNEIQTTNDETFFDILSPSNKRILGISMACISGVLYGFTFTPALYVQDNYVNASQNALDYVFSLYTGIYLSAILYFCLYCIIRKNKPRVYPRIILPALVSGKFYTRSPYFNQTNEIT